MATSTSKVTEARSLVRTGFRHFGVALRGGIVSDMTESRRSDLLVAAAAEAVGAWLADRPSQAAEVRSPSPPVCPHAVQMASLVRQVVRQAIDGLDVGLAANGMPRAKRRRLLRSTVRQDFVRGAVEKRSRPGARVLFDLECDEAEAGL